MQGCRFTPFINKKGLLAAALANGLLDFSTTVGLRLFWVDEEGRCYEGCDARQYRFVRQGDYGDGIL